MLSFVACHRFREFNYIFTDSLKSDTYLLFSSENISTNMESRICKKCTICGVRRLPKSSIFLAKFPLDPDRCRLWVKASGIEDLVYVPIEKLHQLKFICGAHFTRQCFNAKGNRLLASAVPTEGLMRTPLSDDLFTEFPLHIKSYYDKINPAGKHTDKLMSTTEKINMNMAIEASTEINETEAHIYQGGPVLTNVHKTYGTDNFVPIPSTSKTPTHLTYKRKKGVEMYPTANDEISVQNIVSPKKCKTGTTMQMGGEEILVQGYKTSRKSRTNDEITLTKRERRILKRLQESKITIRRMAKSLLNLDKLDSDILKSIVENAVKNYKKAPHGKRWQPQNKTYALSVLLKHTAQALSNTMAAVLKMIAWSDPRSEEINDTAYIVEEMDKLFDCTNGPKSPEDN
ncbi:uncharacterized protein LOC121728141 [Aricia agestis]|uniref:uncharacterized protein LOC121728141 n=1 Tax=Aricia agestis TaxID=91739 RepID=UPI001C20382B|nr:uncharacterized protein LOC121728141 [Aricia agestis]